MICRQFSGRAASPPDYDFLAAFVTLVVLAGAATALRGFVRFRLHRIVHFCEDAFEQAGLGFCGVFSVSFGFVFHNIPRISYPALTKANLLTDALGAFVASLPDAQDESLAPEQIELELIALGAVGFA